MAILQLNAFGGTSLDGVQEYNIDAAGRPVVNRPGLTPKYSVGGAAAAVTHTWAAVPGAAYRLGMVALSYSGAASGNVTLTVADGGTNILILDLSLAIGVPFVLPLPNGGLTGTVGNAMTVTVSAGAASSICKLHTATISA